MRAHFFNNLGWTAKEVRELYVFLFLLALLFLSCSVLIYLNLLEPERAVFVDPMLEIFAFAFSGGLGFRLLFFSVEGFYEIEKAKKAIV